VTEQEICVTSW